MRTLRWTRSVATPPNATWARFVADLWKGGAAFGPTPVIEEAGDAHGTGCTRRIRVGRSGGVRERITATDPPNWLEYRVVNPSWTTFPVDHHLGRVAFEARPGGGTEVRWRVDLVPKRGAGLLVLGMTRLVIGRYLDALERACGAAEGPVPEAPSATS